MSKHCEKKLVILSWPTVIKLKEIFDKKLKPVDALNNDWKE